MKWRAACAAALLWLVASPASAQDADPPAPPAEKTAPGETAAEKTAPEETAAEEAPAEAAKDETKGETPTPEPRGYVDDNLRYPPSSARIGLILGGLGLTAAAYGITALVATTWNDVPGADSLYIPVAGPWIALFQSGCAPDDPDCGAILAFRGIMYVLDGLIQAGGVGIAGEGVFMITESDEAGPDEANTAVNWNVTPLITEHTTGLGVYGTF